MANNGDTLVCWDTVQCRAIFKALIRATYSDSLLDASGAALADCQELKEINDRQAVKYEEKIIFLEESKGNLTTMVANSKKIHENDQKKLKKEKRRTWASLGLALVTTTLAILK